MASKAKANNGDENVCNKLNFIACPILRLAECASRTDEMTNNKYDKLLLESVLYSSVSVYYCICGVSV